MAFLEKQSNRFFFFFAFSYLVNTSFAKTLLFEAVLPHDMNKNKFWNHIAARYHSFWNSLSKIPTCEWPWMVRWNWNWIKLFLLPRAEKLQRLSKFRQFFFSEEDKIKMIAFIIEWWMLTSSAICPGKTCIQQKSRSYDGPYFCP